MATDCKFMGGPHDGLLVGLDRTPETLAVAVAVGEPKLARPETLQEVKDSPQWELVYYRRQLVRDSKGQIVVEYHHVSPAP